MKKLIAGFMTALMALLPLVSAAQLGNYPAFLAGDDGSIDALVVIGSAANVADVVGAVDLAVRLSEVGKTVTSQTCSGAAAAVEGTRKDSVPLSGDLSVIFPSSGVLQSAHYSGLKDAQFSWRGTDYDYREQVNIGSVSMSHDLATSNVNGTEKMIVESGDIKYQYVFEKALTGTGSSTSPNYTYPVSLKMLGMDFSIVGTGSNQVRMLHGSIGTATATTPVKYGDYSIYSDLGSTGTTSWARVIIKDADGNTVDTFTVNQGDSKQSTATGLTVQITSVRALMDGTVVGTDLVVGPTTEGVTKTYDTTADVTSTGTASDKFPGETYWGIQVGSGKFATAGQIAATDTIEVVYKPTSTQYLVAGSKISLPNSYGDLEFEGWNTDKFATVTVAPLGGTISAYNSSLETQAFGNLNGIEISTDVPGSIVSSAGNGYDKAYVLFNYSRNALDHVPVFIGFYDSSKQKILVSGAIVAQDTAQGSTELRSKVIDFGNTTKSGMNILSYPFKLKYSNAGDAEFYLNVTVASKAYTDKVIHTLAAGSSAASGFVITTGYINKTSATTSQAFEFKLGTTAASAQSYEVNATTHSTSRDAGKKSQEIVTDRGLLLEDTNAYGGSDKVVFKIPFKALNATVYFGKKGAGVSGDTVSYTNYPSVPIKSSIAKLDTELTTANKAKNLITVGGSCVNTVTAEALDLTYPACGASSTIPQDKGLIKVVDSPYADGKVVVVVAGWEKDNTRAATSALQQYDTKLAGVTADTVEVTGTVGAPTVTPV